VSYTKTSTYVTTLMYRPGSNSAMGDDAIWTPVGSLTWSWKGGAFWSAQINLWAAEPAPKTDSKLDAPYAQTTTFPIWNTSVEKQRQSGWVTVP
jgi:hypothetical protein